MCSESGEQAVCTTNTSCSRTFSSILIFKFSFEKRTVSQVGLIPALLELETPGLAASHDGRKLLVLKHDQVGSDLVLVSNFR